MSVNALLHSRRRGCVFGCCRGRPGIEQTFRPLVLLRVDGYYFVAADAKSFFLREEASSGDSNGASTTRSLHFVLAWRTKATHKLRHNLMLQDELPQVWFALRSGDDAELRGSGALAEATDRGTHHPFCLEPLGVLLCNGEVQRMLQLAVRGYLLSLRQSRLLPLDLR